jgi:hypothetical protein
MDKTAPAKPTVYGVSSISTKVTGKAEAYSSVEVKVGTKRIGTGKTDVYGKFSAVIPKQTPGTIISVYVIDKAKNRNAKTDVKVSDKTPPARPVINAISPKTTTVTGRAEKYSIITLKVGTKVIGTKKADSYGKFSIKISRLKAGTKVTGTAKDGAGNVSTPATNIVR